MYQPVPPLKDIPVGAWIHFSYSLNSADPARNKPVINGMIQNEITSPLQQLIICFHFNLFRTNFVWLNRNNYSRNQYYTVTHFNTQNVTSTLRTSWNGGKIWSEEFSAIEINVFSRIITGLTGQRCSQSFIYGIHWHCK